MITRKFLFRSAHLMSTSGELRPGYLNSESSDFEGQPAKIRKKKKSLSAIVSYRRDNETGRMVRS
jgi:hypothetical protein